MTNIYPIGANGYTCAVCNQWVLMGTSHICAGGWWPTTTLKPMVAGSIKDRIAKLEEELAALKREVGL